MTEKVRAIASVPDTNFIASAEGETLAIAQAKALEKLDSIIDRIHGIAKGGTKSYEWGKKLKDSAILTPPAE